MKMKVIDMLVKMGKDKNDHYIPFLTKMSEWNLL